MGKTTSIPWTDRTFNPWWGCVEVSPACGGCYAREWSKFTGHGEVWGKGGPRRLFGDKHWAEPLAWDAEAAAAGVRFRVFCLSMGDVFEDHPALVSERVRLLQLIATTPNLDWLLLTKRPEEARGLLQQALATLPLLPGKYERAAIMVSKWLDGEPPLNVWMGATVEDVARLARAGELLRVPAVVHFLSMEPLLQFVDPSRYFTCHCFEPRFAGTQATHEPADLPDGIPCCDFCGRPIAGVDMVIVGGESTQGKHKARGFELEWARRIRDLTRRQVGLFGQNGQPPVAFFMKQGGSRALLPYYELERWREETHNSKPAEVVVDGAPWVVKRDGQPPKRALVRLPLKDSKGEDLAELPADLRVREYPRRAA